MLPSCIILRGSLFIARPDLPSPPGDRYVCIATEMSVLELVALVTLVWSLVVFFVEAIGIAAMYAVALPPAPGRTGRLTPRHSFRFFSAPPSPSASSSLGHRAPNVTIIRPVKGLEPHLYECIASTFLQDYPVDKTSVRLCVAHQSDPAYPILQKLLDDFPAFDAQILVESQDPVLAADQGVGRFGPNPKIRNISRAYREAPGDVIWIIDCNVWVATGVLGRMVDKLTGRGPRSNASRPYKFVHQLPLVVDLGNGRPRSSADRQALLSTGTPLRSDPDGCSTPRSRDWLPTCGGGRLDEMFMATTHAKFYGAINSVAIAPCIVGKSNMFRKSHLDQVTDPSLNPVLSKDERRPRGVDYFSHNICEDHLIGDLLWRSPLPGHRNHGIVWGDLAVQPVAEMSVSAYAARRVRWLRARKWTVLAATLVEPGVESLLCCAYFAFGATTVPWFRASIGASASWKAMGLIWLTAVTAWMSLDWVVFRRLHSGLTMAATKRTPFFAWGAGGSRSSMGRPFLEWVTAWVGREALALPIWTWAVCLGMTVSWRGETFDVRSDATVVQVRSKMTDGLGQKAEKRRNARASHHRLD